jgi:hypothetical protein
MFCTDHDELERTLIDVRAAHAKAAALPGSEEFALAFLVESQAVENLKDHDAKHGCQYAAAV